MEMGAIGATRFRIVRKLGEGGMGVVYEAFDSDRSMPVALKTLAHVNPSALYRFKQEFRSIAGVIHPNLVALYELFVDADERFFTMQLLDGVELMKFVREGCRAATFAPTSTVSSAEAFVATVDYLDLDQTQASAASGPEHPRFAFAPPRLPLEKAATPDPQRIRHVLLQVAEGIAALHRAQKLHRDIKPSNVLVNREGLATVLDFGLAIDTAMANSSRPERVGTLPYMPPEQADGEAVTAASDWYSLGVVLYQALCGELPFPGSVQQMTEAKLRYRLSAPGAVASGVDPELEQLALALLDPKPERRPAEADIVKALSQNGSRIATVIGELQLPVPFYGRKLEEQQLSAAFAASLQGSFAVTLVHGGSGIGKSSLVQQFITAKLNSALVLRGRCYEQESVPYKAIDSAIDALCDHLLQRRTEELKELLPPDIELLAQLFPVLHRLCDRISSDASAVASSDPRRARRRAVAALRELFRRLRRKCPVALVIDDLQWGDVDSIQLLGEVASPPDAPPLLLLCTYRGEYEQRSACLTALSGMRNTHPTLRWFDVPVEPFSPEDSRELALRVLNARPDANLIAERIAQESGGNPYFVLELARHSKGVESGTGATPGLVQVLQRRIAELTPDNRRLLEVIALHGQPLAQVDAYQAAGFAARDPMQLANLRAVNLVRSSGTLEVDEVESFHDRVREATIMALDPSTRRAHHARLAETLAPSGRAEPDILGFHFEYAGRPQEASSYYEAAGDKASTALAFDRAAAHYRHTMDLINAGPRRLAAIRVKLGEALVNAGHCLEAAQEFELAAHASPSEQELDLERRAAFHYTSSGRLDEGRLIFRRVLGRVGVGLSNSPRATVASLVWNSLRLRANGAKFRERDTTLIPRRLLDRFDSVWSMAAPMGMLNTAEGMRFGTKALLLALKAGDPERLVLGLQVSAYALALEGENGRRRARALIDKARALIGENKDPRLTAILLFAEAAAEYVQAEWGKCLRLLEEAEEIFETRLRGVHWELASLRTLELYTLHAMGSFRELRARYVPFLREAEELGDLYSSANVETFCEPIVHIVSDEPKLARQTIASGLQRWKASGYHLQNVMAAHASAWLALYEGRAWENLVNVERDWKLLSANNFHRLENIRVAWLDLRFRTALATANSKSNPPDVRKRASQIAVQIQNSLAREKTWWRMASAAVARSAIQAMAGARAAAAHSLLDAATRFEVFDMLGYAWSARRRAGELLGGASGSELVATAEKWFESESVVRADRVAAMHVGGFDAGA